MKKEAKSVCIISFSGRKNGSCQNIGTFIQNYYGGNSVLFCFSNFKIILVN